MERNSKKRLFGMVVGAMVGMGSFGANLQTFVLGATEITNSTAKLDAGKEYCIGTIDGFLHFRDLVNEGKVGGELKIEENGDVEDSRATITLTENLDLTEGGKYTNGYCDKPIYDEDGKITDWCEAEFDTEGRFQSWKKTGNGGGRYAPIGVLFGEDGDGKTFRAKFNGNEKEIKLTINIVAEGEVACAGVFGCVDEGGEICKLGIAKGSYISASGEQSTNNAGGIAGLAYSGVTISGCYNSGAVTATGVFASAGGILGQAGDTTITGCYNTGAVSASESESGVGAGAGGILGLNDGGEITIAGCYNTGVVTASAGAAAAYAGGIAGNTSGGTINGCYNTGKVKASSADAACAGGIAGSARGAITGCYNTSVVTASAGADAGAGGIAGHTSGAITGCHNSGAVTASASGDGTDAVAGGIAGEASGTVTGCYNTGAVTASADAAADAGGIAGEAFGTVTGCYCLVGCAEKVIGEEADATVKDVVALFAAELRTEGLVEKLNKAVEALKSEVLVETKKILKLSDSDALTTLDEAKQKLEAKLKTETNRELQNLLAKIRGLQALPADGKVFVYAFGRAPALWLEKVPNIELDLGHTRSSIGGDSGFYQAKNGVVTFRVVPNPGYKISRIVTSGSTIIRPGDVVKALPERVMVNFEKV